MAKKQTRRSISVSRSTYERLKAFCETQNISMSQFVENRVGDFLLTGEPAPAGVAPRPVAPRPAVASAPRPAPAPSAPRPTPTPARQPTPMTSAAARYAVEPPPPIIKQRDPGEVKPPVSPTADQIFTF